MAAKKPQANDKRTAQLADVAFSDIQRALQAALDSKYRTGEDDDVYVYVVDVFDTEAVYELNSELWSTGYAYANGEATLLGEPTRVRKTYVPLADNSADTILAAEQVDDETLTLSLDISPGEPPAEFRLFGAGMTQTTKGDLLFDEQAATDVMAAMADHGKSDLPIDYGHGMLSIVTTPDSGKAAGWFKPAIVNGELWASDVEWTPVAAKALRAREYRYHSPAVKYHSETRRISKLVNVALTNLHATKGLKPLVASETDNTSAPGSGAEEATIMSEKLFARLGAKDEAEAVIMLAEHENWTKEVLATLGCTKLDEAVPAIKARADETAKLAEEIVTLTSERDALAAAEADRKQAALIAELSEAGKLPPSLHEWAKTITIEQLAEFGEKTEVSDKADSATPKPATSSDPDVTPEMRAVAKQLNVSLDDIKANLAAQSAE